MGGSLQDPLGLWNHRHMLNLVGHAGASLPGDLAAILVQLCSDLQAQDHLILPLLAPLRSLAAQWPGVLKPLAGCLGLLLQSSGMICSLLQLACRHSPQTPLPAVQAHRSKRQCCVCSAWLLRKRGGWHGLSQVGLPPGS